MSFESKKDLGGSGDEVLNVIGGSAGPLGVLMPKKRTGRTRQARGVQLLFRVLGLATGIAAAVFAYGEESSWWLAIFAFFMTNYFVGGGLGQVFTHDKKIRRTLYFAATPATETGVLLLTYDWWGKWWLAVVLAFIVGGILGMILVRVVFPGISREEMEEARDKVKQNAG